MRARHLAACAALALAAACADRSPTSAPADAPATPAGTITTRLACTVTVAARAMRCTPDRERSSALGALILGGTYVDLTSSNPHFVGSQLIFDVTVTNLLQQKIGTTDGTTAATPGIRPFFHSGPTVTAGTGTAWVIPDGFADFTATGQPYYEYVTVLDSAETSSAQTWTIAYSPTVLSFTFLLYVSVPLQFPNGYITLAPTGGTLNVSGTLQLNATARSALGTPSLAVIDWTVDHPAVATVNGTGLVTAVGSGDATVTATSGVISGTAHIHVN